MKLNTAYTVILLPIKTEKKTEDDYLEGICFDFDGREAAFFPDEETAQKLITECMSFATDRQFVLATITYYTPE